MRQAVTLYTISELKEVSTEGYDRAIADAAEEYEERRNAPWEVECTLDLVEEEFESLGYGSPEFDYLIGCRDAHFKITDANVDARAVLKRLLQTDQAALALKGLGCCESKTIDYVWSTYTHQVEFSSMVADVCECGDDCHSDTCTAEQDSTEILCEALDEAFRQDKESLETRMLTQLRVAYEGDSSEEALVDILEGEGYRFTFDGSVAGY